MTRRNRLQNIIVCFLSLSISSVVNAEPSKTLDELLEIVRQDSTLEKRANIEREEIFKQAKEDQEKLLKEALAVYEKEDKQINSIAETRQNIVPLLLPV